MVLSLPQEGGGMGWGRAAAAAKSAAAAAAAAEKARQGQNEINTAPPLNRPNTCEAVVF